MANNQKVLFAFNSEPFTVGSMSLDFISFVFLVGIILHVSLNECNCCMGGSMKLLPGIL